MLLLPKSLHAALARDTQHSIHSKQLHNLCQNQSALQVELSSFQSIVQTQSKSPLKSFPWKTGAMHFRFVPVRPNITSCMKAILLLCRNMLVACLLKHRRQNRRRLGTMNVDVSNLAHRCCPAITVYKQCWNWPKCLHNRRLHQSSMHMQINLSFARSTVSSCVQEEVATKASPLASLHVHRRVLGVIGILHCPAAKDFEKAYSHFQHLCRCAQCTTTCKFSTFACHNMKPSPACIACTALCVSSCASCQKAWCLSTLPCAQSQLELMSMAMECCSRYMQHNICKGVCSMAGQR